MDPFVLFIVAAVIMVTIALVSSNSKSKKSSSYNNRGAYSRYGTNHVSNRKGSSASFRWPSEQPPAALGVPQGHPAYEAAVRLESSLALDYESRVKDRVLKITPNMSDSEWNWTWFELKRYFLMCAVVKGVPMYSRKVDVVWHEMLMFTREYEQFCIRFCGEMIHHAPHGEGEQPEQGERAWFDWVYGELFAPAPASGRLWGAFYRTRMPDKRLQELHAFQPEELRAQWFNGKTSAHYNDLRHTNDYLIHRARTQLSTVNGKQRNDSSNDDYSGWNGSYDPLLGATGMLSGILLLNSLSNANEDEFNRQMEEAQSEEERESYGYVDGSGYSSDSDEASDNGGNGEDYGNNDGGSYDGGSNDSGGGFDSGGGGSSDSGSSCGGSSCGSGCSSS
ncbi:hypothetical protein [Paenibacillus sp. NEAU-GSW1]|uniref:hypothetical protein n=1 Tax=Paenibacillus sp. NEAU-GSW1 TaxID=2682486 RepID=UPI0012E2BE37|nr:hypothetical protein [Paenibacillus sp. NEAU-GSW1]MUT65090.1 hypothetical protein [Paenibacillus sp. NEAU-GSW1]